MAFLKLYIMSLLIFFSIDLLWLGVIAKDLYRREIGFIMSDEIRWIPALLFYALYIVGLVFFCVSPALKDGRWMLALLYGGLFGLISYATYDLTNLATLKGWPVKLVVYDLIWGTCISGLTCLISFLIAQHWKHYFQS